MTANSQKLRGNAPVRWIVAGMVFTSLTLTGCGFKPLYGTESTAAGMTQYFEQVYVEPIPGRTGVVLRNQLMDAFTPAGTPKGAAFRLIVKLSDKREGLAIQENTTITRFNYTLIADFELRDAQKDEVIHKGQTRTIAAYNVVDSQFATLTAQRDADERATREVGEDIRLRLGIFFESRYGTHNKPR